VINMTDDQKQIRLAEVGGRIREVREDRGLNLHELARLSGISASALSLIETGKRDLRVSSLYRIANALRIDPGDLLDDQAVKPSTDEIGRSESYDLGDYT
jgi:transcriptional regulator with XRE-family HTH domain